VSNGELPPSLTAYLDQLHTNLAHRGLPHCPTAVARQAGKPVVADHVSRQRQRRHDPDDNLYSDGRRVTTTISWGDGFTTLVHSPDPLEDSVSGAGTEELAEELWPEGPPRQTNAVRNRGGRRKECPKRRDHPAPAGWDLR
jgi:hypothetical protein